MSGRRRRRSFLGTDYRDRLRDFVRMFDTGLLLPDERVSSMSLTDLEAAAELLDPVVAKRLRPRGYAPRLGARKEVARPRSTAARQ